MTIEIQAARSKGLKLWEEKLELHINPKPRWCPHPLWRWMCNVVLRQGHRTGGGKFNV